LPEENTLKTHRTQDFHVGNMVVVQQREPPPRLWGAINSIICVLNHHLPTHTYKAHTPCIAYTHTHLGQYIKISYPYLFNYSLIIIITLISPLVRLKVLEVYFLGGSIPSTKQTINYYYYYYYWLSNPFLRKI